VRSPWRESRGRRAGWFGLILAVFVAHALFGMRVGSGLIGWNTSAHARRIDVTFAHKMQPATLPPAAPAPAAAAPRTAHAVRASSVSVPAASAPHPLETAALARSHAQLHERALALAAHGAESGPAAAAAAATVPAPAASVSRTTGISLVAGGGVSAPPPADSASQAIAGPERPAFEWPPSTRLAYTLTGERGAGRHIYGKAVVEWRREGSRYQVGFDIHISPLIDQHMYSEGRITENGLSPSHYDESFSVLFATPRNRRVEFGDTDVLLDNGQRVFKLEQTQDGASQFVQFVWMFYNNPEWLRPGFVVHIPLALPNNLRRWSYQVVGTERLDLAFGAIDAVHLKPLLDGPRRPNEYPFDIWTAPSLQYLPVQILVRVDEQTWALLSLDDLPFQAAGERPPPPPPRSNPFPPPPANGER